MNNIPTVLFIAYEFPPAGGIEIQRVLKFVKYIRKFNIRPVVLTTSHGKSRFMDHSLLNKKYIHETNIIRIGGEKTLLYHRLKNDEHYTNHPYFYHLSLRYIWFLDLYSSWFFEIKPFLSQILINENIKCIYTTSPPASTHLIGEYISKKYDLPWIMDIRDSMVFNPDAKKSATYLILNMIAAYYEKRFCRKADKIITVSKPILDNMADRLGNSIHEKSHIILNGYDHDDFKTINTVPRKSEKLTITYTGSFLGQRTPYYFLEAVKLLMKDDPALAQYFSLNFIGRMTNDIIALFNSVSNIVEVNLIGPVSHSEAISFQLNSDLLLLILAPVHGKHASEVISGKIFEYMAANKPVLGLIPNGPLKEIFNSTRLGFTADPDNIEGISSTLKIILHQWRNGGIKYDPEILEIQKYTREKQAEQLASIIHELTTSSSM